MTSPLIFVVAPPTHLPEAPCDLTELKAAQAAGPTSGFALRIFSRGGNHPDLGQLPFDGRLTGEQRRSSDGTQLLCDALVVRIEPQHHWLGVYRFDEATQRLDCLDRIALRELNNDTCWFYPTHDGTFLSWERGLRLSLQPGLVVDPADELSTAPYERSRISVLWSLLGDDVSLTCVGLTYAGQRLEWPLRSLSPESMATWGRFRVDSQSENSLLVEDCLTMFATSSTDS